MIKRGQANWRMIVISILMLALAVILFLTMNRIITSLTKTP